MSLEIKEKATVHRQLQISVNGVDVVNVSADVNIDNPCAIEGLTPYIQDYALYEQHLDEITPKLVDFSKTAFADKNRLKEEIKQGEKQNEDNQQNNI